MAPRAPQLGRARAARARPRAGTTAGAARRALLELLDSQTCALSALEIEDALRARERPVARASIYRILDELERLRLVQKLQVGQAWRATSRSAAATATTTTWSATAAALSPRSPTRTSRARSRSSAAASRCDVAEHEIVLHGACGDCGV